MDDTSLIKEFITFHRSKGHVVKIRCDNEHIFYDNADPKHNAPIVWDWNKECFYALRHNQELMGSQVSTPFSITLVDFHQIQDMQAYVPIPEVMEFIQEKYTDEKEKKAVTEFMQRAGYSTAWLGKERSSIPSNNIGNKGNIRSEHGLSCELSETESKK